ncbi:MAG: tyrosine-type recombinase/integrase [Alphaproteobacteria bacterium]|nr:tyrosine-type recombinase/integrase [Alphaproteobacteria bacterium]
MKLTDRTIRAMPLPDSGNRIHYDDDVGGFGLRITAGGARAFVLSYRVLGRQRRLTLGGWPELTATAAREMALQAKAAIARGGDPLQERQESRRADTMADLFKTYLAEHAANHNRPSTIREYARLIEKALVPRLGHLKVAAVTARDVHDLHRAMRKTPTSANRAIALLRKVLNLAVKWGHRQDNPAVGFERYHEEARTVTLTEGESQSLLAALNEWREQHTDTRSVDAIEILMQTGARRGEVLSMRWDQIDWENGVWIKPSAHTKQKKEHRVPLIEPTLAILRRIYENGGALSEWVFPGDVDGQHIKEIKRVWAAVLKRAGLPGVHLHDLRHSYATALVESGVSLELVGRLLGHTQVATTRRYAHPGDAILREVAGRIGQRFKPQETAAVVVPLPRKKAE